MEIKLQTTFFFVWNTHPVPLCILIFSVMCTWITCPSLKMFFLSF